MSEPSVTVVRRELHALQGSPSRPERLDGSQPRGSCAAARHAAFDRVLETEEPSALRGRK
jgi:hypothetical protein